MISIVVFCTVAVLMFVGVGVDKYVKSDPGQEWCLQGAVSKTPVVCIRKEEEETNHAEVQGPEVEPHQNLYGEQSAP